MTQEVFYCVCVCVCVEVNNEFSVLGTSQEQGFRRNWNTKRERERATEAWWLCEL